MSNKKNRSKQDVEANVLDDEAAEAVVNEDAEQAEEDAFVSAAVEQHLSTLDAEDGPFDTNVDPDTVGEDMAPVTKWRPEFYDGVTGSTVRLGIEGEDVVIKTAMDIGGGKTKNAQVTVPMHEFKEMLRGLGIRS